MQEIISVYEIIAEDTPTNKNTNKALQNAMIFLAVWHVKQ